MKVRIGVLCAVSVAMLAMWTPALTAQRETAPAGVTNYTRVDATVACAGDSPMTLDGKIATLCRLTGGGGGASVRVAIFATPL